jgi:ferric-dicitrate binding protein FerR (iron transport regulator)
MKGTQKHENHTDKVAELFRHASARERPPAEDELAIRQALHAEWSDMTGRRKRRKALLTLAAAASAVLVVMAGIRMAPESDSAPSLTQLAAVEKAVGMVQITSSDGSLQSPDSATALMSGQQIVTRSDSRMALRWLNGESIRLDENTELILNSSDEITLQAGQIYLDTGRAEADRELTISTPAGRVRHLGTRYMTTVSGDVTSVSVREGRVSVDVKGVETVADQGVRLTVDAAGASSRGSVSSYGPMWQWTEELAPAFSSDGRSMMQFLDWVAHESGRVVEFASTEAERLAGDTDLRGRIDMEPMRALEAILLTSDLVAEVNAGTIVVRLRNGS